MLCKVYTRGVKRAGCWSLVDTLDSVETAANVARSWFAQGYVVRIDIARAEA